MGSEMCIRDSDDDGAMEVEDDGDELFALGGNWVRMPHTSRSEATALSLGGSARGAIGIVGEPFGVVRAL